MDAKAFHDIGIQDARLAESASLVASMVRAAQHIAAHTSLKSEEPAVLASIAQAIASVYLAADR